MIGSYRRGKTPGEPRSHTFTEHVSKTWKHTRDAHISRETAEREPFRGILGKLALTYKQKGPKWLESVFAARSASRERLHIHQMRRILIDSRPFGAEDTHHTSYPALTQDWGIIEGRSPMRNCRRPPQTGPFRKTHSQIKSLWVSRKKLLQLYKNNALCCWILCLSEQSLESEASVVCGQRSV